MADPLIFGYMPQWPLAGKDEPGVTVCALLATATARGRGALTVTPCRVPPDFAGDLSQQPQAYATPAEGDRDGVTAWYVGAIGFTQHEALDALDFVVATLGSQVT